MKHVLVTVILLLSTQAFAQYENQLKKISWGISADKVQNSTQTTFQKSVSVNGAANLRLHFGETKLGKGNYIKIYAQGLKKPLRITDKILKGFSNTTPYFKGSKIKVILSVKNQNTFEGVKFTKLEAMRRSGKVIQSICHDDDRVASSEPRMSRMMRDANGKGGCSGGMISKTCLITAGHCVSSTTDIAEFNVPESMKNRAPVPSLPEDQYARHEIIGHKNNSYGKDWAVIQYKANPITNKFPGEAQGFYKVNFNQIKIGEGIRITGYGTDKGSSNQTQQTDLGELVKFAGSALRYYVDTNPGNSGTPVVHEPTGSIVGVHTHGGCGRSGGSNAGTSIFLNAEFKKAVKVCLAKERALLKRR